MINDVIVTSLTPSKVRSIVAGLQHGKRPQDLIADQFDDLTPYVRATAMVDNTIKRTGPVLLGSVPDDAGLQKALEVSPAQIIDQITASGLRGCGGAGFTTGLKWHFASQTEDDRRFIICNADEGEPGTY